MKILGYFPLALLLTVFLGAASARGEEEIKTLKIGETLSVPEGKVAEFKSAFIYLPNAASALIQANLFGTFQGEAIVFPAVPLKFAVPTTALSGNGSNSAGSPEVPLTMAGPVDFQLSFTADVGAQALVNVVVVIKDAVTSVSPQLVEQTIPQAAVVIPSDATGDTEILLESSTDMVNWVPATPGTYGASTVNRFFRARALRK